MALKMKRFKSVHLNCGIIGLLMLFSACSPVPSPEASADSRVERLPYFGDASFTPHWLEDGDPALASFHRISSFSLINQEGDTITEQDFDDKVYIVDFFFTFCPGICPKMTANMSLLQEEFLENDAVLLLSHSVTPDMDSVPALQAYAQEKGILPHKWHLATGDRAEIYRMGRKEYFIEEDLGLEKRDDEFLHTESFVLIDKHRYIRGIYNGINLSSTNQLIADVKTLLEEE